MKFYLTTPIYYVNGEPHHGHAYTTIAADVLARYHRQKGDDVFFLTGTDEHGTKIAQAAEERGLSPREHVDRMAPRFKELAERVNASNDFFIRTTDPEHEAYVQQFVERLRAAGDIEKRSYGGLYCTGCEGFWYERDLAPDGTCPQHGIKPVYLEEENYYFLLSRYQDRLAELFRANPGWVKPRSRYNEALAFIEQGLDDISISRQSITWGVPVPWDEEQVIYVWVDALINYLSALTYARPGDDLTARYWPASVHFLAKDILKFHAVIWPALLMSAGHELPEQELIHGYLLVGGEKMSKTRGNTLDPFAVIDEVGADPLRFYLMREVTLGQDGDVSLEGLRARYTNELANELGNLLSRTVSMIGKYRGGTIPAAGAEAAALAEVAAAGEGMLRAAGARFDALEVTAALEAVWEYVRRLNRLVEEEAPWKLAKDEAQAGRLDAVLHGLAAGLRLVAVALYPVIPASTLEILRRLGQAHDEGSVRLDAALWDGLVPAAVIAAPPLFPRLDSPGQG
jgi:methionyl-tRNA synthetase